MGCVLFFFYKHWFHFSRRFKIVSAPDPTDAAADGLQTLSGDVIHLQLRPLGLGPRLGSRQVAALITNKSHRSVLSFVTRSRMMDLTRGTSSIHLADSYNDCEKFGKITCNENCSTI